MYENIDAAVACFNQLHENTKIKIIDIKESPRSYKLKMYKTDSSHSIRFAFDGTIVRSEEFITIDIYFADILHILNTEIEKEEIKLALQREGLANKGALQSAT